VDSCFSLCACVCYSVVGKRKRSFCSGKEKAKFLWVGLAHKESRCSLNTDSQNMVSKFVCAIQTSAGIQGVMLSVRLFFAIGGPKGWEASRFSPSIPLTWACPRSKCRDKVSRDDWFQQPVLTCNLA